jgi:hypothetical protein
VDTGARRGRRGLIIGGVAGLVLIALLASGIAFVLGAFAAHTELDAAKYLPGNTVVFSAVDLVNLATNGFKVNLDSLRQSTGSDDASFERDTGLNWQNDVLPWLGRVVAGGAVLNTTAGSSPGSPIGGVFLIQSKDDGKALAALKKVADHSGSGGGQITTASYNGFTLYIQQGFSFDPANADSTGQPNGQTFTAGKGWAVIGTDPSMAKLVVDRLNGTGATLADQQDFQKATSDLPSNRFGTVYVNLRQLENLVPESSGDSSQQFKQLVDLYPTAVGYTSWNDAGLHASVNLQAAKSLGVQYPGGDTTALAKVVPANAVAYVSLGNLGGSIQAAQKALPGAAAPSVQMIESFLGTSITDPALQQPAALAVFSSGEGPDSGAFLLNAPDQSAASALVQKFAAAHTCTLSDATVGGQSVQSLTCPDLSSPVGASGPPPVNASGAVYVTQVNGVLVVAPDATSLQAVLEAASGNSATLAQSASFQQLVKYAPANAQELGYVNLQSIAGSSSNSSLQATALLFSSAIDNEKAQLNVDVALAK